MKACKNCLCFSTNPTNAVRLLAFCFALLKNTRLSAKTTPEVISNYPDHNNIIEITTMQN